MFNELTTPSVVVDLDIAERNIKTFTDHLSQHGIAHRPHIKTHKSLEMGRRQLEAGAIGITVAKLGEAEVFADAGFTNILLAYPIVGGDKLARFAALHQTTSIITTVDSLEIARGLSEVGIQSKKPVRVLIEIDLGMHRCGVQPENVVAFAETLRTLDGIQVIGVMEYNALVRHEESLESMRQALVRESNVVAEVVAELRAKDFDVQIVSTGSTIAGALPESLHGFTEVRAGTYIYHDVSSLTSGIAEEKDCAVRILVTIVSMPIPGRATFDAGSKTLTSDTAPGRPGHGAVVGNPSVLVSGLNEEHGYLQFDPNKTSFSIGERIQIIPNHVCVVSNLTDTIYGVRGDSVIGPISIDARGRNK